MQQQPKTTTTTTSAAALLYQSYVAVPSNEQIEAYMLEKRKRDMLKNLTKYVQTQV